MSSPVIKAAPIVTYNATIPASYGTGNPDNGWTEATVTLPNNGDTISLALRAQVRYGAVEPSDGAGDYSAAAGYGISPDATWNFVFSISDSAGFNMTSLEGNAGVYYHLSSTGLDPFSAFDPLLIPDDAFGSSLTVAQNSENIGFSSLGGDPTVSGVYTYLLTASNVDGTVYDSVAINVDVGSVPDTASTILLAAFGFGLLFVFSRSLGLKRVRS